MVANWPAVRHWQSVPSGRALHARKQTTEDHRAQLAAVGRLAKLLEMTQGQLPTVPETRTRKIERADAKILR